MNKVIIVLALGASALFDDGCVGGPAVKRHRGDAGQRHRKRPHGL